MKRFARLRRAAREAWLGLHEAAGVDPRRLSDGTRVRLGLRVVMVREPMVRGGLGHAYDDKVHEITSLLGGSCSLVEMGPRQENVGYLRAAPAGARVTCGQCTGWHERVRRWANGS